MTTELPDERTLDAQATAYALEHGISYMQALSAVIAVARTQPPAQTQPAQGQAASSDHQLDAAATAYANTHHVSYSEALGCVTAGSSSANFSESTGTDAQALEGQPIEIFRSGVHMDDSGTSRYFSVADIQGMAACYNPALREAPLTIGHPEDNLPAYGWVKNLQATPDGRLLMSATKVNQDFAQIVKAGHYKKRSASFYQPQGAGNPTPGRWYLRHVAWLGAMQPSLHGLADVNFGAGAHTDFVCFG